MKLGIFSLPYNDMKLTEFLNLAAGYGYDAVEITANKDSNHINIDDVVAGQGNKLLREVEARSLTISALTNHFEGMLVMGPHDQTTDAWALSSDAKSKVRFGTERIIKTAQAASELGVTTVVGFVGSNVWDKWYSFPPKNERIYEEAWEIFAERWNPILDKFKEYGVRFALEVMASQMAYNIETCERALKALDYRTEFGFNFEPGHLVWQLIDPVIFIRRFKDRIYYCHAKDAELQSDIIGTSGVASTGAWTRADRGFRFRTPGWGDSNWKRIVSALVESGYDYVLSYEHEDPVMSREDGAEKCIEFLRPLMIKKRLQGNSIFSFE
ncbi:MAG: sugar phosphate isomerase/epimerase [Alicyclobacillus sp.]|nr:sugar phosphate isomerase/epimerase [Alicyclobacillus sp.]